MPQCCLIEATDVEEGCQHARSLFPETQVVIDVGVDPGIDDLREALTLFDRRPPKALVVAYRHGDERAQNTLLKVMEELGDRHLTLVQPPGTALPTIRSRCEVISLVSTPVISDADAAAVMGLLKSIRYKDRRAVRSIAATWDDPKHQLLRSYAATCAAGSQLGDGVITPETGWALLSALREFDGVRPRLAMTVAATRSMEMV